MKKSNQLHELIQSLTKNEKGYFKKHALLHAKDNNSSYILLFNTIENQTIYDENQIKKQLKGNALINNIRVAQAYLYEAIAKSLLLYHDEVSIDNSMMKQFQLLEIFFNKGLLNQCLVMIDKIEKEAVKYEKFEFSYKALQWKIKLFSTKSYINCTEADIETIFKTKKELLKGLEIINDYQHINTKIYYKLSKRKAIRSKKEKVEHNNVLSNKLLKINISKHPLGAQMYYHTALSAHYYFRNDFKNAKQHCISLLNLFDRNPDFEKTARGLRNSVLTNLTECFIGLCQYNNAIECVEKLNLLETKDNFELEQKFTNVNVKLLSIYLSIKDYPSIDKLMPEIKSGFLKWEKQMSKNSKGNLLFNVAKYYFLIKDYKNSQLWMHQLLNDTQYSDLMDIQTSGKLLNLLLNFEKGNSEGLPYIIRTSYEFLLKKERLFKTEKAIIKLLKKSVTITNSKDFLIELTKVKKELLILKEDELEKKVFKYFDFIGWIDSKLQTKKSR